MRNILITSILILGLAVFTNFGFAEENVWEQEFVQALQKGKAKTTGQGEGLGYTPAEESALENAIKAAMDLKAPACEALKIAVDLKYSPYSVIKNVFSHGGEVNLNQLCMCATESGINKQIVAKAAADAITPIGTPVFPRDEIAQAQCLGYTPVVSKLHRIIPPPEPPPFSLAKP